MKFPHWFKILWWIVLLVLLGAFLVPRYHAAMDGNASSLDTGAFGLLFCLLLAPLFTEVDIFGVKLKQEADKIKDHITREVANVRNEIRTDFRTNISPTVHVNTPVQDAKLADIEAQIKEAVERAFAARGEVPPESAEFKTVLDPVTLTAITTRYEIERRVRDLFSITAMNAVSITRSLTQYQSFSFLVHNLAKMGEVDAALAEGLLELYNICSHAIHGQDLSEAQIEFVRNVGPTVIAALDAIQNKMHDSRNGDS